MYRMYSSCDFGVRSRGWFCKFSPHHILSTCAASLIRNLGMVDSKKKSKPAAEYLFQTKNKVPALLVTPGNLHFGQHGSYQNHC